MSTEPDKTKEPDKPNWRRRALIAGVLLALVCKSLPVAYQAPCNVIANICTGGLLP
jgi:hypothetical protein